MLVELIGLQGVEADLYLYRELWVLQERVVVVLEANIHILNVLVELQIQVEVEVVVMMGIRVEQEEVVLL
jgi:hypothetical protein